MRNQNKIENSAERGFTLIEIMVVVAIIALLSSIALIAAMSGEAKSRDARRLSDMTQMNTGLNLYFSNESGYPSSTTGAPSVMVPTYAASVAQNPAPPDGGCGQTPYPAPVPNGVAPGSYYYYPTGTAFLGADGVSTVYSTYEYFFCLGVQTGNYGPGIHILTPTGVQ